MKKSIKPLIIQAVLAAVVGTTSLKAETLAIYDTSFIVDGVPTLAVGGFISARWGQWNAVEGKFNQAIVSGLNAGYADLASPRELSATLNQTSNSTYAPGSLLALAIFASNSGDSSAINWSVTAGGVRQASVVAYAVLTDSAWVAPNFANNTVSVNYTFTANTQAVLGSFSGGAAGGVGIQTITMVPEPSSASLLALGVAGLVALRIRRKR